jgi:hypothetical protein
VIPGRTAAVVAALGLAAAGAARAATPPEPTRLPLTAVQTQVKVHDVKPTGTSVGDRTTFSEELFAGPAESPGARVGTDGGECVVTNVAKAKVTTQCTATLALKGGQVAVHGLGTTGSKTAATFTFAVTGGTGAYTGARGTMTVTGSATSTTSALALEYRLP